MQGYAFLVMAGQGGVRSAARLIQRLALTEAQRAQARDIIDHWKPKPESALASVANPRSGRTARPRSAYRRGRRSLDLAGLGDRRRRGGAFQHGRLVHGHAGCPADRADRCALPVERNRADQSRERPLPGRHEQGNARIVHGCRAVRRGEGFRSDLERQVDDRPIAGRLGTDYSEGPRGCTAGRREGADSARN